jgi:hypothetical protein
LQPDHDFDIETLQGEFVEARWMITKANDIDRRWRDNFEERL